MVGVPFEKGRAKTGGRVKGSRNKISEAFLDDLHTEWEASGAAALKVMAKEEPGNFVKVTASLLPREFDVTQTKLLMEIPDEELNELRDDLRRRIEHRRALLGGGGCGGEPTIN